MARYIGARYVPVMGGEWDNTKEYEPLTVVQYEGDSYTSKMYVPVGVAITNTTYWVKTGYFNQQVANLAQSIQQTDNRVEDIEGDIHDIQDDINNLSSSMLSVKTFEFTNTNTDSIAAHAYKTLTFNASDSAESEVYKLISQQWINAVSLLTGTHSEIAIPIGFAYIVDLRYLAPLSGFREAVISITVVNGEDVTVTLTGGSIKVRYLDVTE